MTPDPATLSALVGVTAFAALLHGAAGFGFGLAAMPGFVWILASTDAVSLVVLLNLGLSCGLAVGLRRSARSSVLRWMLLGALFGAPVGLWLFAWAEPHALLLSVAVVVLLAVALLARRGAARLDRDEGRVELPSGDHVGERAGGGDAPGPTVRTAGAVTTGAVAGAMTVALGMPGPPVVLYLATLRVTKAELRATALTFFVIAYLGALGLQVVAVGVGGSVWVTALLLVPALAVGGWMGDRLSRRVPERAFRNLALLLLGIVGLSALASGLSALTSTLEGC